MTTFSITDEIARLTPAPLEEPEVPLLPQAAAGQLEEITRNLARLGKQQMRSNQSIEFLEARLAEAREEGHEHRREVIRLREEAVHEATKLLDIIDAADDLLVLARQVGNQRWIENLERLTRRVLRAYEQAGMTEISAEGEAFNPEEHLGIDTVEAGEGQERDMIVEVIRRGFRYRGALLRPAEVITTR